MTQTENTSRFNPNEHLIQLKSKAGSQDYLPVQFRLVWFRMVCPEGTIETEEVFIDLDREVETEAYVWNAEKRRSDKVIKQAKGYARFRAIVTDGKGGRATATGSESAVDFPDYIEKAETKAVGRALAALGYGTQFAPEFNEGPRIVDAPIDHQDTVSTNTANGNAPTTAPRAETATSAGNRQTTPASTEQGQRQTATKRQFTPISATPKVDGQQALQDADTTDAKATDQQKASIRKLCQHVSMSIPDLESMSFVDAKTLIAELTAEYKNQRAEQNQPAPAASNSGQSKALLDMIGKAKKRVELLGMNWDDAKTDASLRQVQDADLSPKQVAAINAAVDQYEQRAKAS